MSEIICKYCQSENVRKYGTHKGTAQLKQNPMSANVGRGEDYESTEAIL